MTNINHNPLNLRKCFGHPAEKFMARAVFFADQGPEKQAPTTPEKEPKKLVDLDQFKNETEFKPDRTETLNKLALNDSVLAENFEKAIQESLDRQGYDGKIDDFWKEMEAQYKCKKVDVKEGRIHFLNDQGIEVAPKFSVVPIVIDLSKFNPDTPRSKYYDPDTKIVNLKAGTETKKITVANIVTGARDGTEVIVTVPGKKPRHAIFSENGKNAYYDDNINTRERVAIFDGYKVDLVRKAEVVETKETETYGKYPPAGEYKYIKAGTAGATEGYSAEDFINTALGVDGKMKPGIIDESNKNIVRLREMFKNKDNQYTVEKYTDFLKSKGAIKKDRIALLVDTDFLSAAEQAAKLETDKAKKTADSSARLEGSKKDRDKYYLPANLLEKRKFKLTDPKLVDALSSPKKWETAWKDDSIEGLKVLKRIITSEPDIFGEYSKSPDLLMEPLRKAIYQGKADQIDFEDLIDDILKVRMPSFADKADKSSVEKLQPPGQKFSEYYEKMSKGNQSLDVVQKAYGFLKKLGAESYESATTKTKGDSLWLNFVFEGKGYTVKVNSGGAVVGERTLQIFYLDSETPIPSGAAGYQDGARYALSTLNEGDFKANNEVQNWFRDAVTPPMTYSRFVVVFNSNFNPDGSPKTEMPAEYVQRMRNIVIGGNKFLLQLRDMQYTEKSGGEVGKAGFAENRHGEVKDEAFLDLVGDDKAWAKEWANPTRDTTKLLKQAFQDDPVLRDMAAKDPNGISKRVQDAITTGEDEYLYVDDVIKYVLKGMRMPSHAPEAKELPKGIKFTDYYKENEKHNDADVWALLVLKSLGSESLSRAVVDGHTEKGLTITTTFENRIYVLELRPPGATHIIEIKTPDGKPYPDSNGYDNSKQFLGNMTEADSPKILNWFRDAVRPPLKNASDFRKEYARLFDAQGNPKEGVSPEIAERFNAIMRASNRLVMAFEGSKESVKESSEGTYASQLLRNSKLETQTYDYDKVWSADDIYNNYKGEQLNSVPALTEIKNGGVGLQMNDDILGTELTDVVVKNKLALFRAVLEPFPLEQLINQGCIKKGKSSKLPNQEFYVIDNLPKTFVDYMKAKTAPGEITNFEKVVANKQNLSAPEYKELLNPQAKLHRIAEFFFPIKESERTYEDVGAGVSKSKAEARIYDRMDYKFAHTQFLKTISGETENGSINAPIVETRMLSMLQSYLELFNNSFKLQYGPVQSDIDKVEKPFTDAFGGTLPKLDMASLEAIMKDPKKAAVLTSAIRDGFVFSHESKIDTQHKEAVKKLGEDFTKWKDMITEEEFNTLREALRNQKIPEAEIPLVIEKLLPVWFGLGIDTSNGIFGIAAGVIYPIQLGKNGQYGTLTIGGGVGVGKGINGPGVGGAVGVAYKTTNLGPFALFAGGGVGAGINTSGSVGVGYGVGGGVSIEWGTAGSTKISSDVGIAYVPGMPFPLPGVTVTFEKNHEASLVNLKTEARQKFGLDKIDAELATAKTDPERKTIIGKNAFFRNNYEKAYKEKFESADPIDVVAKFKRYEANLDDTIRQNYDPTLFLGLSKIIVGFGLDPDSGKFIFLVGGTLVTGKEVKVVALEGKKADVMEQEIQISHMNDLAERYNSGEIKKGSTESYEIDSSITAGKLLLTPDSKDLVVYMPKEVPVPAPVPIKLSENATSTEKMEAKFNEKLIPLNLRVEYNPAKKLFELKFSDWNDQTNYDIAVDSKMKEGGMIVDEGHVYLANDFSKVSTLTILRSDYEYPFNKEGKNYRSIITISDSPLTPAHEIYNSSREILSSKGGNWFPQQGSGYDKYGTPEASRFYSTAESQKYAFDAAKFEKAQGAAPTDDADTKKNIDKLSITEAEKGTADETECAKFAADFLKTHPSDYRTMSNEESLTNKSEDLNKVIVDSWKKSHASKELNPAELNLIRLKIMDASFVELGNVKGKARLEAFKSRLEKTEQKIMLPRFRKLIKDNHEKYKEGDPNYIRMKAEDLSRIIMARVRNIDVNTDAGATLLSKIDRTSTVAGTLGIFGFRGEVYGGDNKDPNQIMIGSSVDYLSFLKSKPESAEADIARLIFEETSKMPKHVDIKADTPTETLNLVKTDIYDLLRADLPQKIISLLFTPYNKDLFSPGVREEILRLAANKDNLTFNANSAKALVEFQSMVVNIRQAEMSGEKYYIPANAPDYRFILTPEVHDGVYKKCTNYSMWINEGLKLEHGTSKIVIGPDLTAAYGISTGTTVSESQLESTAVTLAAAVAVKPKPAEIPPPPKTATPKAGTGSESDVDTKVKGSPGAKAGGASE